MQQGCQHRGTHWLRSQWRGPQRRAAQRRGTRSCSRRRCSAYGRKRSRARATWRSRTAPRLWHATVACCCCWMPPPAGSSGADATWAVGCKSRPPAIAFVNWIISRQVAVVVRRCAQKLCALHQRHACLCCEACNAARQSKELARRHVCCPAGIVSLSANAGPLVPVLFVCWGRRCSQCLTAWFRAWPSVYAHGQPQADECSDALCPAVAYPGCACRGRRSSWGMRVRPQASPSANTHLAWSLMATGTRRIQQRAFAAFFFGLLEQGS